MKRKIVFVILLIMCLFSSCKSQAQRKYEKAVKEQQEAQKKYEDAKKEFEDFQSDYNSWKKQYDKVQGAK